MEQQLVSSAKEVVPLAKLREEPVKAAIRMVADLYIEKMYAQKSDGVGAFYYLSNGKDDANDSFVDFVNAEFSKEEYYRTKPEFPGLLLEEIVARSKQEVEVLTVIHDAYPNALKQKRI